MWRVDEIWMNMRLRTIFGKAEEFSSRSGPRLCSPLCAIFSRPFGNAEFMSSTKSIEFDEHETSKHTAWNNERYYRRYSKVLTRKWLSSSDQNFILEIVFYICNTLQYIFELLCLVWDDILTRRYYNLLYLGFYFYYD